MRVVRKRAPAIFLRLWNLCLELTMPPDSDLEFSRQLREKVTQHKAPSQLRKRILTNIEGQRQALPAGRMDAFLHYLRGNWRALSTAAVCGVALTMVGTHYLTVNSGSDALAQQMLMQQLSASHIRAMVTGHLIDVVSSDQHTVKPWFAGKLDYSPPVNTFVADGFELTGGRLDYLNDRLVAALVYKRRLHTIDAYAWPANETNPTITRHTRNGINIVEWTSESMRYGLVSDIEFGELMALAKLMQNQRLN